MRYRRLLIAAGLALGLGLSARAQTTAVSTEDMTLGNARAPVTVIQYASLACPHCAAWNRDVWPAFKAKYVDTGKVRYVYREFITSPPEVAAAGALLARCAGRDKYFSVIDDVFKAQPEIYRQRSLAPLVGVAAKAGLDEARLTACIGDQKAVEALNSRVQRYVEADQIESTPTFVINGVKLPGEASLEKLDGVIAAAAGK